MQDYQMDIHIGFGSDEQHRMIRGKFLHGADAVLSALHILSQTFGDEFLDNGCRIFVRRRDKGVAVVPQSASPVEQDCAYCC